MLFVWRGSVLKKIAPQLDVMTPITVTFEALSDEIEEPFGAMPNDLALDAMAVGIESALLELLGERDLSAVPQPVDHVLT